MDYSLLFDFETKTMLSLFDVLSQTNTPISLEELSQVLTLNEKTTMIYLNRLTVYFQQYKLTRLAIDRKDKNHFFLKQTPTEIAAFRKNFLLACPEIYLLSEIVQKRSLNFTKASRVLQLRESTLRKRLGKLRTWIQTFDLQISRANYELCGEEATIREFILQFYTSVYQGFTYPLFKEHLQTTREVLSRVIDFFQLTINDIQEKKMSTMIQITVYRFKQRKPIALASSWNFYRTGDSLFSLFCQHFYDLVLSDDLDEEELLYIYLLIQAKFSAYFSKNRQKYIIKSHFQAQSQPYQASVTIGRELKNFFSDVQISFTQEILLSFISFHLYYALIDKFLYESIEHFDQIETKYPNLFEKITRFVDQFEKKYSLTHIHREALFYRCFLVFSVIVPPVYYESKKIICLLVDFPVEKEKILEREIHNYYSQQLNIKVNQARQMHSIYYADVIVTSTIVPELFKKFKKAILLIDSNYTTSLFVELDRILKK